MLRRVGMAVSAAVLCAFAASPDTAAAAEQQAATDAALPLQLQAVIVSGAKPIQRNVSFMLERVEQGRREMVANLTGGVANLDIKPGKYRLTTAYGATVIEEDIEVRSAKDLPHEVTLNAGEIGLRMIPAAGAQAIRAPIQWQILSYRKNGKGERDLLFSAKAAETEVVLPAGWYMVRAEHENTMTKHIIEVGAGTRYVYTLVRQ